MSKVKVIETTDTGEVVHEMWSVDAREAVRNDPERWRVAQPEAVVDNSPTGLAEQIADLKAKLAAVQGDQDPAPARTRRPRAEPAA